MANKEEFIEALADFLVGDETVKSLRLSARLPDGVEWQKLRSKTPLFGYYHGEAGKQRAVRELKEFLR